MGKNRINLKQFFILSSLFILFVFVFFQYKKAVNAHNRHNQYLIATIYRPENLMAEKQKNELQEFIITEPLNNEEFMQQAKAMVKNTQNSQKVILRNLENYEDEDSKSENITLKEVALIRSPSITKLLISRTYNKNDNDDLEVVPFLITSTGELNLSSNTLEYSVTVTNKTEPVHWVNHLSSFSQAVQEANHLSFSKSIVCIQSKKDQFIYDSEISNQLTEMIIQETE